MTRDDLTGEISNFPVEVVQAMCEHQVRQGNPFNPAVFAGRKVASRKNGGFDWSFTADYFDFWEHVIRDEDFSLFFAKYRKK